MNPTRNGKIARLPREVREFLNLRLQEGEQGKKLVAWLNALPEVRTVAATGRNGGPIREQNLSEWRKGGYRDWLAHQEAREVAERFGKDAVEWRGEARPPLTETLALWLAARYAVATRRVAEAEGPEGWRLLREMCGDIVELRRGDHSTQRLHLERERAAARDAHMHWKRKIVGGLETLMKHCKNNPKARAAVDAVAEACNGRFDKAETGTPDHKPGEAKP